MAPPAFADDVFRLAHHDTSGELLLHPRATALGLAAGLLLELYWGQHLDIRATRVIRGPRSHQPPVDALAHRVLDQIQTRLDPAEVRTWLGFVSFDAYEQVVDRLWRAGHLQPITVRRWLRQTIVYQPTEALAAARPRIRLTVALSRQEPLEPADIVLLGLAQATGLDTELLRDVPREGHAYAGHLRACVPAAIDELLAQTTAAIADAVLAYGT